jgi:hypothetical protein
MAREIEHEFVECGGGLCTMPAHMCHADHGNCGPGVYAHRAPTDCASCEVGHAPTPGPTGYMWHEYGDGEPVPCTRPA